MILENAVAFNSRNSSDSPRSREKFPIRWTRNDVDDDDDDDGSPFSIPPVTISRRGITGKSEA